MSLEPQMSLDPQAELGALLDRVLQLEPAAGLAPGTRLGRIHRDGLEAGEQTQRTEALLSHATQWTGKPQPTQRELPRSNADERRRRDGLRWRRLRDQALRLEHERIAFGLVGRTVAALAGRCAED